MPLATGTRLGPYEILAPAGAGGMGEVYRARDTRLERIVAIKVLPEHLSDKPELRQRLEREARAVSRLSHPNICTLHDIGHQDGMDFLVMEYVEGETLERRLERGPLPSDQVLKNAIEIVDALDKAHRQGITHRDLKPGNIIVTKVGVKLLDFGLAKMAEPQPALVETALTEMTAEKKLTAEGTLLGTFQYMAPEQLEGRKADARTDIFALGAVMYEMATGKPAFTGRTKASLIASILSSQPAPISALQPVSPPALDRVVHQCLAKDPDDRWQTAHDVKLELEWIAQAGTQAGVPAPVMERRKNRERLAWGLAAVVALVAGIGFYLAYLEHSGLYRHAIRSFINVPEKAHFEFTGDAAGPVVISPDGSRLAFVARNSEGVQLLWARPLDAAVAEPLPGTEDATFPFWSPESKSIGFFARGKLKRIDATGGPAQTLCDAQGRGGSWNQDGTIIFARWFRSGLFQIRASGGEPQPLTRLDESKHSTHRWPHFLPDGKHFLYLAQRHEPGVTSENGIYVASLDGKENQFLFPSSSQAVYASGYLLFVREQTLMAQSFDPDTRRLKGDPFPLAERVLFDDGVWRGLFDASQNGILVYQAGRGVAPSRLAWIDRTGKLVDSFVVKSGFQTLSLSRDDRKIALQGNPVNDIWVYDTERRLATRLTFDSLPHSLPLWSPDGKWIAYTTITSGNSSIHRKASNGAGAEEVLLQSSFSKFTNDWSRDGRLIVLALRPESGARRSELWILPLFGDRKPFPFLQTPFATDDGHFSPDGRWLSFTSDESGKQEIYVAAFPGPGGKWQVSIDGGRSDRWSSDGKELYYRTLDDRMMVAHVSTQGEDFQVGKVEQLFKVNASQVFPAFEVSRDGKRFLMPSPPEENTAPITLVVNWTAGLKK